MSLHVIFIDKDGQQLSDVTSNFTSVTIPQNAFIMRICDDTKSYSNSTLTKLFEIDNTFYSKVLEYTTKGDYQVIDVGVQDFGGFTAIFNQLSAQFVGNDPPEDIYDFSGYGGSGSGSDIDFSTIVTALNSIASALSALTNLSNLSNLADLANIISAIQNKDNQSDIVSELRFIFTNTISNKASYPYRLLNGLKNFSAVKNNTYPMNSDDIGYYGTLIPILSKICSLLSVSNSPSFESSNIVGDKAILRVIKTDLDNINNSISGIETKLEQNLPFTTIVENDIVETNISQNCSYGSKIEQIPFSE